MRQLILASQSLRRSELLHRAGFTFTILSVQISEIPDENLNLTDQIRHLARDKAIACLNSGKIPKGQGNLLLSADTVVVLGDQILGKPKDRNENRDFLRQLSGQTHRVITGVCLLDVDSGEVALDHDLALIEFKQLSAEEIEIYVNSSDGLDKAGGYGIQGEAAAFVAELNGSFDTVMGLPIQLVEHLLTENSWEIARKVKGDV